MKTNKHSPRKKITTKQGSRDTDPECLYAYRSIPISEAMIERMIEEMPQWYKDNPKQKSVTRYYLSKGISQTAYYELLKRHKRLKETHDSIMQLMGEDLWMESVYKEAHWPAAHFRLYSYGKEFKEAYEFQKSMNEKQQETTQFNIVMPEVPSSPLVPDKHKDE